MGKNNFFNWATVFITAALLAFPCLAGQVFAGDKVTLALPGQSMGYLPLKVAIHRGFFKDEGIDIETPRLMPNLAQNALMSGRTGYNGLADSALALAARGAAIKVIFYGADRPMYFLLSRDDINSVKELKGKKVAISRYGGTSDLSARLVLRHFGVDPDGEAAILQIGSESSRIAALKSKSVDAAIVTVPNIVMLRGHGFNELAYVGDIVEFASNGYTTTDERIRERPEEVKKVLRAIYRGLRYSKENREGSVEVIKREWKIDEETASKSYDAIVKALDDDGIIGQEQLKVHFDLIRSRYKDVTDIPIDKVVDFSLLKEVIRELNGK
jgi:ABC-type nitrate/sulfonate/bicarbonate transport system substrate-binding protein